MAGITGGGVRRHRRMSAYIHTHIRTYMYCTMPLHLFSIPSKWWKCYIYSKVTWGNSGHGVFPVTQNKAVIHYKHYFFQHSCNTALVVGALSYNIPDSEVRCLLPVRCLAATSSSSERFATIFNQKTLNFPSYLQNNERRSGKSTSRWCHIFANIQIPLLGRLSLEW